MDPNLLEKYWNAETTPQEEQQLLEQLSGKTGPDATYFTMLSEARKQKSTLTIHDIRRHNEKLSSTMQGPAVIPIYRWIASAAAILVFVVAGLGLWNYSRQVTEPVQMAETFDDPYEAYEEVREALAFVSAKLNKSQNEAMINIQKAGEYADMFK